MKKLFYLTICMSIIKERVSGQGQTLIPGDPKDLSGIVGLDGIPIVENGQNMAMIRSGRCQWNTLHGVQPSNGEGTQTNRWQSFIGDEKFFIKECGACLARADNAKGCPSPSLAWAYDCRANIIYTYGKCIRDHSAYFLFVVYIFPISIITWIICWLCCIKVRMCPLNRFINWYRAKNKRTKTDGFGVA